MLARALVSRPDILIVDEPVTGRGALSEDPSVHGNIARADLAALILDCLARPDTIGRTFSAVDRAFLAEAG